MASAVQKRQIAAARARAKAGVTMSNDPRRRSRSSSSTKRTVIYDNKGRVTQSNDPSKPVGSINLSKSKTSVLNQSPSFINKSVVFSRQNNKVTRNIFGSSGLESATVIQTRSTPKSSRKTTSQLAKETRDIKTAQIAQARKSFGRVGDKFYIGLTPQEMLSGRLNNNSRAVEIKERSIGTAAAQRLARGQGTSSDIIKVLGKGKKKVDILANIGSAEQLSKTQKSALKKKKDKLEASARSQFSKKVDSIGIKFLNDINLNTKQQSAFKQFARGAGSAARDEALSIGRGALKLTTAPSTKNQASFLDAPIFRKYWSTPLGRKHKRFLVKFKGAAVSEQKNILKDKDVQGFVALTGMLLLPASKLTTAFFKSLGALGLGYSAAALTDNLIKGNYRESGKAAFSALVSVVALKAGGRKGGKTIKATKVTKIPKITKKFKFGTILQDKNGKLMVVGRGGRTKTLPKQTLTSPKKVQKKLLKEAIATKKGPAPKAKTQATKAIRKAKQDFADFTRSFERSAEQKARAFKRSIEPFIIQGKKAQAKRGRKLSKASLRRQNQGLPSKQGQVRFNQGEYVQKSSPKKGVTESIRFNTVTQKTTLVRSGKGSKTSITFDRNFNTLNGNVNLGKGQSMSLGKKGFSRPASQLKTTRTIEKDLPFVINRNAGYYKVLQTERVAFQKSILSKSPKFIPKGSKTGLVLKQIPKTKGIARGAKTKSQLSKSKTAPQRQVTGREKVRAKLIKQAKAKQLQAKFKAAPKKGVARKAVKTSGRTRKVTRRTVKPKTKKTKPVTQTKKSSISRRKSQTRKTTSIRTKADRSRRQSIAAKRLQINQKGQARLAPMKIVGTKSSSVKVSELKVGKDIKFRQAEQVDIFVENRLQRANAFISSVSRTNFTPANLDVTANLKLSLKIGLSKTIKKVQDQAKDEVQRFDRVIQQLEKLDQSLVGVKDKARKSPSPKKPSPRTPKNIDKIIKVQKPIKDKIIKLKKLKQTRRIRVRELIKALRIKYPKFKKPVKTKKVIKQGSVKKKKKKRKFTSTLSGVKKRASTKQRKQRRFTGTEVRGK